MKVKTLTTLLVQAVFLSTVLAELEFESTISEHDIREGQKLVKASFSFQNTGSDPVTITKVSSTCDCLRAEADRKIYAPGESGTIEADFSLKGRSGLFKKSVLVYTESPTEPTFRLAVQAKIQDIIAIEPKMTVWQASNNPEAKRITFRVQRKEPIHILRVLTTRPNVKATLHTLEKGRHYEIEVQPTDASSKMLGVVKIETDCDISNQKNQLAFFRIES